MLLIRGKKKQQRNLTSLQLAVRTKIFMHLHCSDAPRYSELAGGHFVGQTGKYLSLP